MYESNCVKMIFCMDMILCVNDVYIHKYYEGAPTPRVHDIFLPTFRIGDVRQSAMLD